MHGTLSCSSTGTATLTGIATAGNTAGASVLLDPLVAKDLKEIESFGTKEKLSQWLHQNTLITVEDYWNTGVDKWR